MAAKSIAKKNVFFLPILLATGVAATTPIIFAACPYTRYAVVSDICIPKKEIISVSVLFR